MDCLFSVVVPLYNKADFVRAALESVFQQTFGDYEVVVVDDGSTDDSPRIAESFVGDRLRLIATKNGGSGQARNVGIANSASDWVAFLDADDLWAPDHLEELARIRCRHPDAGLLGTYCLPMNRLMPTDGQISRIRQFGYFGAFAAGELSLAPSSAAVHKAAWKAVGGFPVDPLSFGSEDTTLWVRIALAGWPVASSTKVTSFYRVATGGIIDSRRHRWVGKPPKNLRELSYAARTALDASPHVRCARLRKDLDGFVYRYVHWTLHHSLRIGDVQTVRALWHLVGGRLSLWDAIASLPCWLLTEDQARKLYALYFHLRSRLPQHPWFPA